MKSHLKVVYNRDKRAAPALLNIDSLSVGFTTTNGCVSVLQDVSFSVDQGEIVCILGRSGCGKTTLLNLLAGFLKPDIGSVQLAGKNVDGPGTNRCVVFQENALFPWLTVRENIDFGLQQRGFNKKQRNIEVERFIELVGLAGYADHLPEEISGGMKQRVALARVLILAPEVLLLDEPFAALDAQTRGEMQLLLMQLSRKLSHTVLFVTHDIEEALLLADRILILDKASKGIKCIIDVTLPRYRSKQDQLFVRMNRELTEILKAPSESCDVKDCAQCPPAGGDAHNL
ncbi:NitT/TauT family transport system ATP-binding protein [Desulfuromusa kysingii]|uniref:NitT/TauT family transport system ATP-binding protein n=1 Tax=Desulfuromusa kysingii TaxID=37625 RepID=A0A1H4A0I4_9BACT|nr:ABC transporter ATP-binding protein [Desulfuromusa kysingii]SEA29466.1 NitT/TauT family transport system ATP-binding protein [Desulfuromusa kysingii]